MSNSSPPKSQFIYLIWPAAIIVLLLVFRALWGGSGNEVGEKIYQNYCAGCHGATGEGHGKLVPPLAGADFLHKQQDKLACIILYGIEGPIVVNGITYDQPMAGIGFDELGLPRLSPSQIQQLINFIQSSWGNQGPQVNRQQVTEDLENCDVPAFQ